MKILKNSVVNTLSACLLLTLGGGGIGLITYVAYATSCSNSTPPEPTPPEGSIPFTTEYFDWTSNGNQLTIDGLKNDIDLSGYNTLWIPPSCVSDGIQYRVIAIGDDAFYQKFSSSSNPSIIKLDLVNASNLLNIGDRAFFECSGFNGSLTIPNSVTSISLGAFVDCFGFTGSLTIPNSVTSIGAGAFMFCSGFTGSLTIPNSVTDIDDYAFYGCSSFNGTLTIPDSVTSIGNFVFEYCSGFNTINVSDWTTIPTIGNYAFLYFNTEGGIVLVPANYDDLGITISTFKGLPSTWQLSPV